MTTTERSKWTTKRHRADRSAQRIDQSFRFSYGKGLQAFSGGFIQVHLVPPAPCSVPCAFSLALAGSSRKP